MIFSSLEDTISLENPIRFIDAFVENIDFRALGFEVNLGFIHNFFMGSQKHEKTKQKLLLKKEDYKSS